VCSAPVELDQIVFPLARRCAIEGRGEFRKAGDLDLVEGWWRQFRTKLHLRLSSSSNEEQSIRRAVRQKTVSKPITGTSPEHRLLSSRSRRLGVKRKLCRQHAFGAR
jgi:hypothetical protein